MPQTNTTWEQFKLTIDDPQILAVLEVYAEELEAEVDRLVSASKTMSEQQAPAEAILDAISEPNVVTTYKMRILDERLKTRSELWDSSES